MNNYFFYKTNDNTQVFKTDITHQPPAHPTDTIPNFEGPKIQTLPQPQQYNKTYANNNFVSTPIAMYRQPTYYHESFEGYSELPATQGVNINILAPSTNNHPYYSKPNMNVISKPASYIPHQKISYVPPISLAVEAFYWKQKNTICYEVKYNGVVIVRKSDDDMINGTKLLNACQMGRGRRDGVLKSIKVRFVNKTGERKLKGIWIPIEIAILLAKKEGVYYSLYPLFEPDISTKIDSIKNANKNINLPQDSLNTPPIYKYNEDIVNFNGINNYAHDVQLNVNEKSLILNDYINNNDYSNIPENYLNSNKNNNNVNDGLHTLYDDQPQPFWNQHPQN